MNPEEYRQSQEVFLELREASPSEQKERIEQLRLESRVIADMVESLLAADDQTSSFLEAPLVSLSKLDQVAQSPAPSQVDSLGERFGETKTFETNRPESPIERILPSSIN